MFLVSLFHTKLKVVKKALIQMKHLIAFLERICTPNFLLFGQTTIKKNNNYNLIKNYKNNTLFTRGVHVSLCSFRSSASFLCFCSISALA